MFSYNLVACHDIDQWPDPCPGETLNLPIMGTVVQVCISLYIYIYIYIYILLFTISCQFYKMCLLCVTSPGTYNNS